MHIFFEKLIWGVFVEGGISNNLDKIYMYISARSHDHKSLCIYYAFTFAVVTTITDEAY